MRTIINYIKTLLCKHDWLISEGFVTKEKYGYSAAGIRVSMCCKKCGYHKSFWKY